MKVRKGCLIAIVIVLAIVAALALFGWYIYNNVIKGLVDPEMKAAVVREIVSHDLPEKYSVIMAMRMMGTKLAVFERKESKQMIVLIMLAKKDSLSDSDIKEMITSIRSDDSKAFINKFLASSKDVSDIKMLDKGVYRLSGGYEVPYITSSFVKDGEKKEGFLGILSFPDPGQTVFIVDLAEPGKYDFTMTQEFLECIGAPESSGKTRRQVDER